MIVIAAIILVVVGAVIVRRMVSGGSASAIQQDDEVYEVLEDHAEPKSRDELIHRLSWEHSAPDIDHNPGCYVILVYPDKKTRRQNPDDYELAYVGRSSNSAAKGALKHVLGQGNVRLAKNIRDQKKPFSVALLPCEDYGMDIEDCEKALRRIFADKRLLAKK